jgi:hypothetical protein
MTKSREIELLKTGTYRAIYAVHEEHNAITNNMQPSFFLPSPDQSIFPKFSSTFCKKYRRLPCSYITFSRDIMALLVTTTSIHKYNNFSMTIVTFNIICMLLTLDPNRLNKSSASDKQNKISIDETFVVQ